MALSKIGLGTSANDGTGDDLRTAGGKINAAIDEVNKIYKYQIHASSLLPLTANSAYYLEIDVFPAQVFSETTTEGVKLIIPNSAIPVGATPTLKVRFQAYHHDDAPVNRDVCWEASAAWVADGATGISLGTAQYAVMTLESTNEKLLWSSQTASITPSGLRESGADVRILIRRNVAYEVAESIQDTLDAPAYLYKIELEWEV